MLGVGLNIPQVAVGYPFTFKEVVIPYFQDTGAYGLYYDISRPETLFVDSAGTTPAVVADPIGRVDDVSGNGNAALQTNTSLKPIYKLNPGRLDHDKVDDQLSTTFATPITGTLLYGTPNGVIHTEASVAAGDWPLATDARYMPDGGEITGVVFVDDVLTPEQVKAFTDELIANGAGSNNFSGVTDTTNWFRVRTDLTAIYAGGWDTSNVTSFLAFAYAASSLTTLDVSNLYTSSATDFRYFAYSALSLTSLDVSNWDTSSATAFFRFAYGALSLTTVTVNGGTGNPFADSPCTDYDGAFQSTNLTQQSIDDILVAIELAGTSGGTFDQSGGSAPSSTGESAVTSLRSRGWTVTVTGGF